MFPEDLMYTVEHEWVRVDGGVVQVGITDYAQSALGDIVFVQLPSVGDVVKAGATLGEVESTKSVSDIYAPVSGRVTEVNSALDATPELVNSDPYDAGWMLRIEMSDPADLEPMLDAAGYAAHTTA